MWPEITKQLTIFSSAVINGRDADGYPASARTTVSADAERQELLVQLAPELELQPGPASLLFHDHNEQLWNQRVFLVRGQLAHGDNGWVFRPLSIPAGMSANGPLAMVQAIMTCRKVATAYLRKRNLPRPAIPWAQLKAIKSR